MRYSKFLLPTQKETPNDCDSTAMSYMVRAGMIKKVSSGLFYYLPYFNMILRKVSYILRRGMDKVSCNEMKFPILVSRDILEQSERWKAFGKEMFKVCDRNGNDYAISPTNEEYATLVAGSYVKSYNDLPFSIYQIQQKHRDEIRPRNGLVRAREFTMKDAYSFHANTQDLDKYYAQMVQVYNEMFEKMGIKTVPVVADMGVMGGRYCHEFMAVTNEGEAEIAFCNHCKFGANLETVAIVDNYVENTTFKGNFKEVYTPNVHSISELCKYLSTSANNFLKSMVYKADGNLVMAVVRGDRQVNEVKLKNLLHAVEFDLADEKDIKNIGSIMGFVGPIGNLSNVKIVIDNEVKAMQNFVIGANKKDYHLIDVNVSDLLKHDWADIRFADGNDICPVCGNKLNVAMGNELGHVFALGQRYTSKFNTTFVDADGKSKLMEMGCYGIGLERCVASIIDQHHDEKGLVLPMNIAPFKVDVIIIDNKKEEQVKFAEQIYNSLEEEGIPVLLDDRNVRAGVKFNDFELIGVPLRVTVGRTLEQGEVEIEIRKTGEKIICKCDDTIKVLKKLIKNIQ